MKKGFKVVVPLICVAVVGVTFYMIIDIKNKVEKVNYGTDDIKNTEFDNNTSNIESEINEDNETENVVSTNTTELNTTNDNTINSTNVVSEEVTEEDAYSSNKFEQAIKLVQNKWGEDSSVYFTSEGVDNKSGLYLVAVRDKSTTAVKNYFKVNLETKKVEIDY